MCSIKLISILRIIHISKASNLVMSSFLRVHVSAQYNLPLCIHKYVHTLKCPKTHEKMKSGSIVTANLQKVSFVHVDTKCEVLPDLNNIYGSRRIIINQPLWLKSSKC